MISKIYDGDIICRSKFCSGSNFIFIVALGDETNKNILSPKLSRLMNPIQKTYEKIILSNNDHLLQIQDLAALKTNKLAAKRVDFKDQM